MKNIEFNTQICTTIEQSKRLLELGLDANTADCYHYAIQYFDGVCYENTGKMAIGLRSNIDNEGHFDYLLESYGLDDMDCFIPSWSLHRLIAMLPNVIYTTILSVPINDPDIKIIDFEHNSIEYLSTSGCRMFYKNKGKYALYNNIIDCIEWLIQEGYFNKGYLKEK